MNTQVLVIPTLLAIIFPGVMRADILNLGVLSFDSFIPASLGPGVNAFDINNYTGDPTAGGFALPPDFGSLRAITFKDSALKLIGSTTVTIALGDVGPGPTAPAVQFPDTATFSSAEFMATLDQTTFQLSSGGIFTANFDAIDVLLTPASGSNLIADTDFALITVSGTFTAVPEPASWFTLGTLLFGLLAFRRFGGSIPRSDKSHILGFETGIERARGLRGMNVL